MFRLRIVVEGTSLRSQRIMMLSTLAERLFSRRVNTEGRVSPFNKSSAILNGSAIGISNPQAAGVLRVNFEKEFLAAENPLNISGVLVRGLTDVCKVGLCESSMVLDLEGLRAPAIGGNILRKIIAIQIEEDARVCTSLSAKSQFFQLTNDTWSSRWKAIARVHGLLLSRPW